MPSSAELANILEKFDERLHAVEQTMTGPDVMGAANNPDPDLDSLTIDGLVLDATPPGSVTGASAIPGTYYDDIFVDVSWTEAVGGIDSTVFELELSEVLAGPTYDLLNIVQTAGTDYRFTGLKPSTNYRVRIWGVSRLGVRSAAPTTVNFTTGIDSTVPPAPTGVVIARGATTVLVKFTPLTKAQAPDVANGNGIYEIEIDTATSFATGNKKSMLSNDQIVSFSDVLTEGTWYARVRAIDSSGNVGSWSSTSSAATAGGVIDSMIVAGLDAAKITVGFLSASRIQAGTLSADKLMTSTLTAADITINGGSFKVGAPPTTGILINSQGIRGYNAGVATFILDNSGNVTVTGNINGSTITGSNITGGTIIGSTYKSAASGTRIEVGLNDADPSPSVTNIVQNISFYPKFFPSPFAPGMVFAYDDSVGNTTVLRMQAGQRTSSFTDGAIEITNSLFGSSIVLDAQFIVPEGVISLKYNGPTSRLISYSESAPSAVWGAFGGPDLWQLCALVARAGGTNDYVTAVSMQQQSIGWAGVMVGGNGGGAGAFVHFLNYAGTGYVSLKAAAFTVASSERYKKEIRRISSHRPSEVIDGSRTARYTRRDQCHPDAEVKLEESEEFGFVAEEVYEFFPEAVSLDKDGKPDGVNYMMFIPVLVDEVRSLRIRVKELEGTK